MTNLGKALKEVDAIPGKLRTVDRDRPTCSIRSGVFTRATMTTVSEGATPRAVGYRRHDGGEELYRSGARGGVSAAPIAHAIGATFLSRCTQAPSQRADIGVVDADDERERSTPGPPTRAG